MAYSMANSADGYVLEQIIGKTAPEPLRMGLYVNSQAFVAATNVLSITELTAIGGYTKKDLVPSSWQTTIGPPNFVTAPAQVWTFTASAGDVQGYFYVGSTTGKLYGGEQFTDGPYTIVRSGDSISITPKITAA